MFIALVVVTVLLALVAVFSASMKLRKAEQSVAVINGVVGVPLAALPVLAALEIAGAAGIVIGLWVEPLGVAAAIGLVAYFVGALIGHLRVRDTKNLAMPLPPLVLSIAVLTLRLLTA
ncbi:DoxX family protein [Kribbella sp. NPDC006257]|uniref:DoxX family protein n=1 Tax=Kribbella sp. NPDC006257 TaxID=3156738 RepID=UPI0033A20FDC